MSYECPYCDAELVYDCEWGVGAHWIRENNPEGEIYKCPNAEGFEDVQEALDYVEANQDENWIIERWEDILCESGIHNVSGSFYTDRSGELKEGIHVRVS